MTPSENPDVGDSMWHMARLLVYHAVDTESEMDDYFFEGWRVRVERHPPQRHLDAEGQAGEQA